MMYCSWQSTHDLRWWGYTGDSFSGYSYSGWLGCPGCSNSAIIWHFALLLNGDLANAWFLGDIKQSKFLISFPLLGTNFWYLLSLNLDSHLCINTQLLSRVWLFVIPWTISLPGSSVHGIFQASILEWVAISSSRGSSQSRDQTHIPLFSDTAQMLPMPWNPHHCCCC